MRKVALITGGSRGIGRACVEAFARAGYTVVFFCRQRTDLAEALAAGLRAEGHDVSWMQCDVADLHQVDACITQVLRMQHHIDVLVNNAAVALISLFTDTTPEQWDHIFNVNVRGVYSVTRAVLPGMISRRSGSVINLSSMWGEVGASCEVAYSAAKAAVIGMTKALAQEVGPSGVRVNCVSPGVIRTDMNSELDESALTELADATPLCRIGEAEEVAQTVLFLAGEGASFVTGQVLGVSGGYCI